MLIKNRQQQIGIAFDPALPLRPSIGWRLLLECRNMKIIFDIDAEIILDRHVFRSQLK